MGFVIDVWKRGCLIESSVADSAKPVTEVLRAFWCPNERTTGNVIDFLLWRSTTARTPRSLEKRFALNHNHVLLKRFMVFLIKISGCH